MGRKKNQVTPVAQADREFVLGAAARLFRQKGFDKTTVKEIAEAKMVDLNANTIDQAMQIILGSARSMGIEVK